MPTFVTNLYLSIKRRGELCLCRNKPILAVTARQLSKNVYGLNFHRKRKRLRVNSVAKLLMYKEK